jgi:hypothetical protein
MALQFFDCNTMIGRRMLRTPFEFKDVDSLVSELDHLGISEALVYHSLAKEYFPPEGNKRLMKTIADHERLHPCWVIMPHHTDEMENPALLMAMLIDSGVQAVRMFPSPPVPLPEFAFQLHRYALIETVCGELLEGLQRHRMPLFIEAQTFFAAPLVSWERIEWILGRYPELPLVIGGLRQRDNRTLYALMDRFTNLYLDITLYAVHRGIEDVVRRFGANRMLFGSGLPVYAGGGPVMQLLYSDIEEHQKQMIAGDNLRSLLKGAGSGG